MSGLLELEGVRAQDVGTILAAILQASRRPATEILQNLSGAALRIQVLSSGERQMTAAEQYRLSAGGIARCNWRNGLLRTQDGLVAASVSLLWLPARLPFGACTALDEGTEPAGVILGKLGMRREDRRAMATRGIEEVTGADAAARSSAVLMVAGQAVGIAEEHITRQFAESLA
jgi:hypothetical protein